MKNRCAYCKKEGKLTREHIIPKSLCELDPSLTVGFSEPAKGWIKAEPLIKDVCEKCNSDYLSKVDSYGKRLYLENGFDRSFAEDGTVEFKYDYDFLLRYLLKISYNSARTLERDLEWIEPFSKFILYGIDPPKEIKTSIFLEIMKSYKIKQGDRHKLPKETRNREYLTPEIIRVSRAYEIGIQLEGIVRLVSVKAFYFYIPLLHAEKSRSALRRSIKSFLEILPCAQKLEPNKNRMRIRISKRTCFDAMKHDYWGQDYWGMIR